MHEPYSRHTSQPTWATQSALQAPSTKSTQPDPQTPSTTTPATRAARWALTWTDRPWTTPGHQTRHFPSWVFPSAPVQKDPAPSSTSAASSAAFSVARAPTSRQVMRTMLLRPVAMAGTLEGLAKNSDPGQAAAAVGAVVASTARTAHLAGGAERAPQSAALVRSSLGATWRVPIRAGTAQASLAWWAARTGRTD